MALGLGLFLLTGATEKSWKTISWPTHDFSFSPFVLMNVFCACLSEFCRRLVVFLSRVLGGLYSPRCHDEIGVLCCSHEPAQKCGVKIVRKKRHDALLQMTGEKGVCKDAGARRCRLPHSCFVVVVTRVRKSLRLHLRVRLSADICTGRVAAVVDVSQQLSQIDA